MHGIRIEDRLLKHQKSIAKKKKKQQMEDQLDSTANELIVPQHKSNYELNRLIEKRLKFPVVIKPLNEGSSVNVFICKKKILSEI